VIKCSFCPDFIAAGDWACSTACGATVCDSECGAAHAKDCIECSQDQAYYEEEIRLEWELTQS